MLDPVRDYWLHHLRRQSSPVFAVLDAARDPRVLPLLRELGGHRSLHDGEEAEELADVAPYLIELPPGRPHLERVVAEGWGRAWGIFLTSGASAELVRSHLQALLYARTEDGAARYLRFYDPRVLRAFVPVCTPPELAEVFGPIERFIVEARRPTLAHVYSRRGGELVQERVGVER